MRNPHSKQGKKNITLPLVYYTTEAKTRLSETVG